MAPQASWHACCISLAMCNLSGAASLYCAVGPMPPVATNTSARTAAGQAVSMSTIAALQLRTSAHSAAVPACGKKDPHCCKLQLGDKVLWQRDAAKPQIRKRPYQHGIHLDRGSLQCLGHAVDCGLRGRCAALPDTSSCHIPVNYRRPHRYPDFHHGTQDDASPVCSNTFHK
jgi:hypothetical protein